MKYIRYLVLPALASAAAAFIMLKSLPDMPPASKGLAVAMLFLLLGYPYVWFGYRREKRARDERDLIVDRILSETGKGAITIATHAAQRIAEGMDEAAVKNWIGAAGFPSQLHPDIYRRARYFAAPPFLCDGQQADSKARSRPWHGHALMVLGALAVGYWLSSKNPVGLAVAGIGLWFAHDLLIDSWLAASGKFPQLVASGDAGANPPDESRQARLLREIINSTLAGFGCEGIVGGRVRFLFTEDCQMRARPAPGAQADGVDIVVTRSGVERHDYSGDPREPYGLAKFDTLDAFLHDFILTRVCGLRGQEVVFLPELYKLYAAKASADTNTAVERLMARTDLHKKLDRQHREYYSGQVSRCLKGWPQRVMRMFL